MPSRISQWPTPRGNGGRSVGVSDRPTNIIARHQRFSSSKKHLGKITPRETSWQKMGYKYIFLQPRLDLDVLFLCSEPWFEVSTLPPVWGFTTTKLQLGTSGGEWTFWRHCFNHGAALCLLEFGCQGVFGAKQRFLFVKLEISSSFSDSSDYLTISMLL